MFANDTNATLEEVTTSQVEAGQPKAGVSVSGTVPKGGQFITSSGTYYFETGDTIVAMSVSWTPVDQPIQLGFVSSDKLTRYWTSEYTGGGLVPRTIKFKGTSGYYYLSVRSGYDTTSPIQVIANFDI